GIPTFENQNGRMMEGGGGAAMLDFIIRARKRQSVFRSYSFPLMDRPNLTVLTHALVTRITFDDKRATGVEIVRDGKIYHVGANLEVVLSLGAIQTPKVLMQSGIGDEAELQRFGIPVVQHLPGVGQNFQGHPAFGCIWEYREMVPPRVGDVTFFWKSDSNKDSPDLQTCVTQFPLSSAENAARSGLPESGWTLLGGLVQPKSRGCIRLTGGNPLDPIQIEANDLSHPDDLKAAIALVALCREIGNSSSLRRF